MTFGGYTKPTENFLPAHLRQTRVKVCVACRPHKFQDSRYGKKRRVMNRTRAKGWRCTVCGNTTGR